MSYSDISKRNQKLYARLEENTTKLEEVYAKYMELNDERKEIKLELEENLDKITEFLKRKRDCYPIQIDKLLNHYNRDK